MRREINRIFHRVLLFFELSKTKMSFLGNTETQRQNSVEFME